MKTTHVIAAIVAGMAAGATIGILYAPDKGSTTRLKVSSTGLTVAKKLKSGFNDVVDTVLGKYEDAKDDFASLRDDGKEKKNQYSS